MGDVVAITDDRISEQMVAIVEEAGGPDYRQVALPTRENDRRALRSR